MEITTLEELIADCKRTSDYFMADIFTKKLEEAKKRAAAPPKRYYKYLDALKATRTYPPQFCIMIKERVKGHDKHRFLVGSVDKIVETVVEKNLCSFKIYTSEGEAKNMLIMDLECYPPQTVYRSGNNMSCLCFSVGVGASRSLTLQIRV